MEEDILDQGETVKVSSPFSSGSSSISSTSNDQFSILHLDQQTVIDSLTPPSYSMEPLFSPPLTFTTIAGLSPSVYSQSLSSFTPPPPVSTKMLCLPRSPSPQTSQSQIVQFFLNYHQETINEAHYFRSYDYSHLCTKVILAMAETSNALQHAVVAFSALIYSIKVHQGVRVLAFLYYSKAMEELRILLNEPTMEINDCLTAVATALQLSSFDVYST